MNGNNNFLKHALAIALLSFTTLSGTVQAAENQKYTINLQATIPSESFQVIPVDTGWINQTYDMGYDVNSKKLKALEKQFQYKNTTGGIQAALVDTNSDGQAVLSNGTDTIPLAVTFNDVALSKTATPVVTKDQAKAGGRTALRITQSDDKALTVSGLFTGSVAMVFEPLIEKP